MARATLLGMASAAASLGAAAALYASYRRDLKRLIAAVEAGSEIIDTAGGPIEYGREGSGPPVLVVHGAGGGYDQGLFLGRDMFGPAFDVIAPSRFGYLRTWLPDIATPAAQADAHAALLDRIKVPEAIVVGVSAGAPSAIELALRHPSRVTALILAVPRAWSPDAELSQQPFESARVFKAVETGGDFSYWLAMRLARPSVVHFLGVPQTLEAKASPQERARVTEVMRSILPLSRRLAGLRNDSATEIRGWPLERVKAPTLIISAADDLYGTLPLARYTAERIRGAELMELESGGHLMVGRGAEVRARILAFLGRQERLAAAA